MARPRKSPARREVLQPRKKQKQQAALSAINDDYNTEDSPIVHSSDSETVLDNQDEEQKLKQLNDAVKSSKKLIKANENRAKDFEARVEQRRSDILARIEQHKKKIEDGKSAFEASMLPILLSALAPISIGPSEKAIEQTNDSKLKPSTLEAHNLKLYEYSEQLCKDMTDFLRLYTDLAKRDTPVARIEEYHNRLVEDKENVSRWISAGAKKSKQQVQMGFATKDLQTIPVISMTKEEEVNAITFERSTESHGREIEEHGADWEVFVRKVTGAVRKIERLAAET